MISIVYLLFVAFCIDCVVISSILFYLYCFSCSARPRDIDMARDIRVQSTLDLLDFTEA